MTARSIDGKKLGEMFIHGASLLGQNVKEVDALNVFPVPDGDTGTNMNLTITSGVKEVKQSPGEAASEVAKAFSKGLLMGARGNSGVILSQLFRGFAKGLEGQQEVDGPVLAKAFETGVETAYKAVMKPVEGTILTVAKDAARSAKKSAKKKQSVHDVLEDVIKEANASLQRTPELLPVLKEVGVVDSGGQGLVYIYEGMLANLEGKSVPAERVNQPAMDELVKVEHHQSAQSHMNTEDIEFGYCTEVMVRFEEEKLEQHPFDETAFREELSRHGDSLLVVSDEDLVKVHIHAEHPGEVLSLAQQHGSLVNIKIENMREQHTTLLHEHEEAHSSMEEGKKADPSQETETAEYGIVTVSMGEGIANLFKGLGADVVIPGGQTMNPSTEDIVKAIEQTNAENIFVLPNNGNIVMAAEQAAEVSEKNVICIPTKSVPQGLSSLFVFNSELSPEENKEAMTEALGEVTTGQVTYAVRDTTIDGKEISEGDFMGIAEKKIVSSGSSLAEVTKSLLKEIIDEDAEIVTLIQGEGADEEITVQLTTFIEANYDEVEVEVHNGEQPLYSYIIAVE
ncbi:DAK2 domain-containing protein [Bacillus sp. FJAT-44742]|uniref:DAK2 domain-containing protein n=1 Tax=Bacillus sp. FJAT-44742 TaxID=2014005 RepID=UPI000C233895|nr:DAK2 domain-containing protein [Bacillus sp. FJAT-44742]